MFLTMDQTIREGVADVFWRMWGDIGSTTLFFQPGLEKGGITGLFMRG